MLFIAKYPCLKLAAVVALLLVFCSTACTSTKKATYFNGLSDSTIKAEAQSLEPVIQKNDLLSISISSLSSEASAVFNTPNLSTLQATTSVGNSAIVSGYLVDQDGNIKFPILGEINAAGLTKKILADNITKKIIDLKQLYDPIVTIRYLNYRVTVLGEVGHPTQINVPNEKITLLEALGLAGDLTIYAKRDNVMVIRVEENGDKTIKYLNLNSNELFTSPYFYLKSNDVVYVQPNKTKVASTGRANQLLPVIFAGLSLLIIAADKLIN